MPEMEKRKKACRSECRINSVCFALPELINSANLNLHALNKQQHTRREISLTIETFGWEVVL